MALLMILVTGGTGFVGQEVVRELLALGHRVRLLVRHPKRANPFKHNPRVELFQGDALQPETLVAAMVDVKAVVHLIGIIAETSRVTFEQAHIEATRHVLDAAKKAGVRRWLQMSAAGTRPEASSRYHQTKWQAEELVRQSGLDWTIFRPSLIYGHNERDRILTVFRLVLASPFSFFLLHLFPVLNGGRALVQPVSIREVARCFARAIATEVALSQTYDLVGPVAFSWREMVFKVANYFGLSPVYEDFPLKTMLRAMLWLVIFILPILIVVGRYRQTLNLVEIELGSSLVAVFLVVASTWTRPIVFSVSSGLLRNLSAVAQACLPRALHFGEQLKMAGEDNVGDPLPAAKAFDYEPESFEQGLEQRYTSR